MPQIQLRETISIIIPTHNRLNYLLESLTSAIKQKVENNYVLNIIVSDNSTNSDTEEYFSSTTYTPNVKYIRRTSPLSPLEHFNTILREINSDFFMIFHDDDVMRENMVAELLASFTPSTVAAASNAYILKNSYRTTKKFGDDTYTPNPITTKKELIGCLILGKGGPPVFDSFLYRRIVAQKVRFELKYRDYSDSHFICQILDYGSIQFVKKPLFYYRLHSGQGVARANFVARSRLINYAAQEHNYSKKDRIIVRQRLISIYCEFKERISEQNIPSLKRMFQFVLLCMIHLKVTLVARLMKDLCLTKFRKNTSFNTST